MATTLNRSDRAYNEYNSLAYTPKNTTTSLPAQRIDRNTMEYGPSYNFKGYSYDDIYNTIAQNYGVSASGGYRPNTSQAIAAINSAANANRDIVSSTYNTKRSDLLDSLKRYQDSNAKQVANQKSSYLTSRSALDTAKEQANRQSRISNAARGLGGSGLQQLAELQNDLGLQGDQSLLANSNQRELDNLKTLLTNYTEDTNKGLDNALIDYQNALKSIDADTAQRIADVNYQADMVAAQNSLAQASLQGNAKQTANALYNALNSTINDKNSTTSLAGVLTSMSQKELAKQYGLKTSASKTAIGNAILSDYMTQLNSLNAMYGITPQNYNTARDNIINALKFYGYM